MSASPKCWYLFTRLYGTSSQIHLDCSQAVYLPPFSCIGAGRQAPGWRPCLQSGHNSNESSRMPSLFALAEPKGASPRVKRTALHSALHRCELAAEAKTRRRTNKALLVLKFSENSSRSNRRAARCSGNRKPSSVYSQGPTSSIQTCNKIRSHLQLLGDNIRVDATKKNTTHFNRC
jgi:hypothetical protein